MTCVHAYWNLASNVCTTCGATADEIRRERYSWSTFDGTDIATGPISPMSGGPSNIYQAKKAQHGPSEHEGAMPSTEEYLDKPSTLTYWKSGETRWASDYEVYCKRTHRVLTDTPLGDACEANSEEGWVEFADAEGKERVSGMEIEIRRKRRDRA